MKQLEFTNMSKDLLGEELYLKLLTEISKDYKSEDMIEYGKEVIDKCCLLILTLGMSKVDLDNIELYLKDGVVKVSCKEFAEKFQTYTDEVKSKIMQKLS